MVKTVFMMALPLHFFCFFCFALTSCTTSHEQCKNALPAFYHWQTQLKLTMVERNYLDSLGVKKLYVKFFDVDWDEGAAQPVPLASLDMDPTYIAGLEIVPTIFITNRTLLNLPIQEVDSLASRILKKIHSLTIQPPAEVQFDCDWTSQTQSKFFALLKSCKAKWPDISLSATIRLHQLKYPDKTGVPPVDRGMLMCYNMDDLEDWETENAILNLETAKRYLTPTPKYPLPLDIALPIFRWGVLFRDGHMIKLLNNLSSAALQDTTRFKETATNRFEVVKSTYLQAHYLYAGDQLRLEGATPNTVNELAMLLNSTIGSSSSPCTVAFYHLDTVAVRLFPKEKIVQVLQRF